MKKTLDIIVLVGIVIILIFGIICCVNSIKINKKIKNVEEDVKKIKNEVVWEYEDEIDEEEFYDDEYYYDDEDYEEDVDGEYEEPEFDEETEEEEQ